MHLLLLSLLALLPAHVVLADTGPKPTMEFTFKQELSGETATITSGILYECEHKRLNYNITNDEQFFVNN